MNDSIAGILIGVYLLVVIGRSRGADLIELLKGEARFLRWFIAILLLLGLAQYIGKAAAPFMALIFISMALSSQTTGALANALETFNKAFKPQ